MKIRKIVMKNTALSRQIDTKTMKLTIICVVIVLVLYFGQYVFLFANAIDPDATPAYMVG